jgi:cysteine desulfurase
MRTDLRYFDYAATTPADPRVITAMADCLGMEGVFGNPASSSHAVGLRARAMVDTAREQVALLIGARAGEIVWTSGATESNNLALKGFVDATATVPHIVTSRLEHKAILDTATSLERRGYPVTYVEPDRTGAITPAAVGAALGADTGIVSVMLVNNEIGTVTDIAAIAPLVHAAGALLHVDAAQALGKVPVDVKSMGVDLMSMSAHKVYGPKGMGALYVAEAAAARLAPQMHGGGHEGGLRSGTLPTHQIVGMGVACEIANAEMQAENKRIAALAKRLLVGVLAVDGIVQNVRGAVVVPHTISLTVVRDDFFPFLLASDLAISSTSACNSAAGTVSHVLSAIGLDEPAASRTIRISLGRFTTERDVDHAIDCIQRVVDQCRPPQ